MNKHFSSDQAQPSEQVRQAEIMLKKRLALIDQPSAYDFRLLATFYLNARRWDEANSIQFQMLQLASAEANLELVQALYQDLGWSALLAGDPARARRHFSCQRATLEEIHQRSESNTVFRESDLNLFVATNRLRMWGTSRRHLGRLWESFEGRETGFREFVIGRQESLNSELSGFHRLRTRVFLETLEQVENKQPTTSWTDAKSSLN